MAAVRTKADANSPRFIGAVVGTTASLYVAACFLPTTSFLGGSCGLLDLVFGWLAGLQGLPAWSANFLLVAGVVCMLRRQFRAAAGCTWLGAALGLTVLTSFKADQKYVGYYLWLASQVLLANGASLAWWRARRQEAGQTKLVQPTRPT
jgi:hypothetical protein